jgi:hypothetical protein
MSLRKKLNPKLREDQRMRKAAVQFRPRTVNEMLLQKTLAGIRVDPTITGEEKTAMFADGAALLKRMNRS